MKPILMIRNYCNIDLKDFFKKDYYEKQTISDGKWKTFLQRSNILFPNRNWISRSVEKHEYKEIMEKNYRYKYASSKKSTEAINRFTYHTENTIPNLTKKGSIESQSNEKVLKTCQSSNNLTYFWSKERQECEIYVDEQSIIHSIKMTHVGDSCEKEKVFKINESCYRKQYHMKENDGVMKFVNANWNVSEIIEFVLIKQEEKANQNFNENALYELYIIHYCYNQEVQKEKELKWLYFVEKYTFLSNAIVYETVSTLESDQSYFNFSQRERIFPKFINKYSNFDRFQGILMKYHSEIKEKLKENSDPAFSQEHKLLKHIPNEYLKNFYLLKKEFGEEHEQLICRFMIAKDFDLEISRKSIQEYFVWHNKLSQYKWEHFEEFHRMEIFHFLGEDRRGRPVILNRSRKVMVDEIDAEKYCLYYMWFLEVYMPKKMRGFVTQLNIIADVEGLGKSNFKFAITKRNVEDGQKYCAERQYKFFGVNVGSFAYFCYQFIKPLLPKKTQEKVYVGGNNKQEILKGLLQDIDEQVIPTYLGGSNPII